LLGKYRKNVDRHVGPLRDLVDGGGVEPVLLEQLEGGVLDDRPGLHPLARAQAARRVVAVQERHLRRHHHDTVRVSAVTVK
jgi:hypothetical protein